MYKSAIFETSGKQYFAKINDSILIDKINSPESSEIFFDKILIADENIGTPYLNNIKIKAIVEKHGKFKKIIVFKHKSKKNYKRKYGHRQQYTRIKVIEII
ncbi:50S ribosomal protein L21 [Mycoplasma sp. SG1]|uniref:50S ribosomal protein L21 n=1 Tax=Mycoplasma sp. SG1 TaxID=2810348 RepID=UPI002025685D|nr:50S ribosomal protein L21 [Mycoplasma sp. SG1]URM53106.1 50S ribosomal protein L21 [Mycoplasma sp. SG1]